jgi:hypothetical protein
MTIASLLLGLVARVATAQEESLVDKRGYTLFNATPANQMRELNADRPDKTDCPFTVDAGHLQLEMDFANVTYNAPTTAHDKLQTRDYQVAPMNVKVGLLNNMDFQLVLQPCQWQRVEDTRTGSVEKDSGFSDITPRVKVNLMGNDGGFFALALIPYLKFPSADHALGNGAYEGGVGIPYAFNVPHWDVGFQTTFSCDHDAVGDGYHADIANSVSIGHAIIGPLEYHVEFFSSVSTEQNAAWIGTFDTWLTYQANKNLVFDGGVYIGVTGAADSWHAWIGMTWRH